MRSVLVVVVMAVMASLGTILGSALAESVSTSELYNVCVRCLGAGIGAGSAVFIIEALRMPPPRRR